MGKNTFSYYKTFLFIFLVFLVTPLFLRAVQIGDSQNFNIDSSYDLTARSQTTATLRRITSKLYFYIDNGWWQSLDSQKQQEVDKALESLDSEFHNKIYPTLISAFGFEWEPGIDNDKHITILIHPMKEEAGGYFTSGDEHPKLQVPTSNEREMIYLNTNYITSPLAKSCLAHELTHLITFNQKDRLRGVSEETWLNEARAEYVSTLLGYDADYEGSNLQRRVKIFLDKPTDSLTEWLNLRYDYGVVNLFTQYLVDHYGSEILTDSLRSLKVGIPSIDEALQKRGFFEDFSQIFTEWTITVLVNDYKFGQKYYYFNLNLKNFRIVPQVNFLPLIGESSLSVTYTTKDWAGNWQKIIGGKNVLKLEFQGDPRVQFRMPYLVEDFEGKISINFLPLDQNQKGVIYVENFNSKNKSLIIIPSIHTKIFGFDGLENSYQFSFIASTVERTPEQEAELIKKLLVQIEQLKKQITEVQAKIDAILVSRGQKSTCSKFERDLFFGMMNSQEVRCLQEFLKSQGQEIYPEGLVTGNFLDLTQAAVSRFQEKYNSEILTPLGLQKGTGYVGPATRNKINQLLGK